MKFKKILSIIFSTAIILCNFATVFAASAETNYSADDHIDYPCGGVIEMVDVKILYSPLSSRISIGDYKPDLEWMVLLITYPDGEKEILTVEEKDGLYYAGNFKVNIYFWFNEEPPEYGFICKMLDVSWYKDWGGYDSDTDFVYLYLPSFKEIPNIVSSYFNK